MRTPTLLLSALLLLANTPAFAQWVWLDKDGRKVFSDRPPPPEVPAASLLKQPGQAMRNAASPASTTDAAPTEAPRNGAKSSLDKAVEDRKRQAEAAESEKKKAEEARIAAQRAESCARARQNMATLDSGIRVAQVNEKGERIILDDSARSAETSRIQAIIDADCR